MKWDILVEVPIGNTLGVKLSTSEEKMLNGNGGALYFNYWITSIGKRKGGKYYL